MERILVINPGSTSTKIAVYDDETPLFVESIEHKQEELSKYAEINDQLEMRTNLIVTTLNDKNVELDTINTIVSRGGLLPPVHSGAYLINEDMVFQLKYHPQNEHASNLGAQIAYSLSKKLGIDAYVYDPVTVDEMISIVRVTGLPEMQRKGMGHNLNMRAAAIKYAEDEGKDYKELNIIVAHMGGGITLSLHSKGRIIDMISDDEGSFSPERAGGLPIFQVAKMMTCPEYGYKSFMKKIKSMGGLYAHCGTKDAREIEKQITLGDKKAELVYEAMALNVAKNIAKLSVVTYGKVDAIILTGGMAYSKMLTNWITERVKFIAPVKILAGENEMQSLALGALRVKRGEETVRIFVKDC